MSKNVALSDDVYERLNREKGDRSFSEVTGTLKRRGEPLDHLHDVYTGATARTERLPVLTANVSHFERIDDVDVVDWTAH